VPRDARRWLDAAWLAALIGPLAFLCGRRSAAIPATLAVVEGLAAVPALGALAPLTRPQWGGVILVSLTSIALARIGVLRTKARERSPQ